MTRFEDNPEISRRVSTLIYVSFDESDEVRGGPRSILMTARHLRRYKPTFVLNRANSYANDIRSSGIDAHVVPAARVLDGFRTAPFQEKCRRFAHLFRHNVDLVKLAGQTRAAIFHCQEASEAITAGVAMRLTGRYVVLHVRDQSGGRLRTFLMAAAIASRVIFISGPLRNEYISQTPAILKRWIASRSEAINNGIEPGVAKTVRDTLSKIEARQDLGLNPSWFVLTVIGPLTPKKNQLAFLKAAGAKLLALHAGLRIVFVGSDRIDASYSAELADVVSALADKERVVFLGSLPHAQMTSVYRATDVLLIPSVREGLPRIALEGTSLGCPIVASRNAGNEAGVINGETGFLVGLDHLEDFVPCVERLLDDAYREGMSKAAVTFAETAFDVRAVTARIEDLYDRCLNKPTFRASSGPLSA